jgi:hypothetical protein
MAPAPARDNIKSTVDMVMKMLAPCLCFGAEVPPMAEAAGFLGMKEVWNLVSILFT